jgi:hypothetical protein
LLHGLAQENNLAVFGTQIANDDNAPLNEAIDISESVRMRRSRLIDALGRLYQAQKKTSAKRIPWLRIENDASLVRNWPEGVGMRSAFWVADELTKLEAAMSIIEFT